MKRFSIGVLCFVCLFSTHKSLMAQPVVIDLLQALDNKLSIKLSDLATNVKYIKLETTPECMIGHTNKAFIHNDYLVVPHLSIFAFDTLGNYRSTLAVRGKGPGEFIEYGGIDFNQNNHHMYLLDRAIRTIQVYDLASGFVTNLKGKYGVNARPLGESYFCSFYPTRFLGLSDFYTLVLTDKNGETVKTMMKKDASILADMQKMPVQNWELYHYHDSLSFWDGFNDTLFSITPDLKLTPRYVLDLGKQKVPAKLKKGASSPDYWDEMNQYSYISRLYESDRYVFMNCSHQGAYKQVLYDKLKKTAGYFENGTSFLNDYDGGIDCWPHGVLDDGRLYYIIQMNRLKAHFEDNTRPQPINPSAAKQLADLVNQSDEADNPVIMIITLK